MQTGLLFEKLNFHLYSSTTMFWTFQTTKSSVVNMADDDHMEEIISANNTGKKELNLNNVSETLEDKLNFNENSAVVCFVILLLWFAFTITHTVLWGNPAFPGLVQQQYDFVS